MINGFAVAIGLSITASVMVGIIAGLRVVLRKRHIISRAAFVFLWLLVFLRLCIPFGVDLDFGGGAEPMPNQMAYQAIADAGISVAGDVGVPLPLRSDEAPIRAAEAGDRAAASNFTPQAVLIHILALLWMAGVGGTAVFFGIAYRKKIREIKALPSVPVSPELGLLFAHLKEKTGVSRKVTLKISRDGGTAVYGVCRPTIVIDTTDPEKAELLLIHELIHIKNHDNLKKGFAALALSLHWFNPVIWMGRRLFCRDIEMQCDEAVLKVIGRSEKKAYAGAILCSAVVEGAGPAFSCMGESSVAERIRHVLALRKRTVVMPVICAGAAVFLLLGCFASPVYGVSEQIAESGGAHLESRFLELHLPGTQDTEILDYITMAEGAMFLIEDKYEREYRFTLVNEDGPQESYSVSGDEGRFVGSIYYYDNKIYFALEKADARQIQVLDLETSLRNVIITTGKDTAMNLFGGCGYLCWYEGQVLRLFCLDTGAVETSFLTTGTQDYGAILENCLTYQYHDGETGRVMIRCLDLLTGKSIFIPSLLGKDTYSVYGNQSFIVYKEDFGEGADIQVYNRETETDKSLWSMLTEEKIELLRYRKWGISLVGNHLILSGEGDRVYTIDLNTFAVQSEGVSREGGIGYYTSKSSGRAMSAMLYTEKDGGVGGTGNLFVGEMTEK